MIISSKRLKYAGSKVIFQVVLAFSMVGYKGQETGFPHFLRIYLIIVRSIVSSIIIIDLTLTFASYDVSSAMEASRKSLNYVSTIPNSALLI